MQAGQHQQTSIVSEMKRPGRSTTRQRRVLVLTYWPSEFSQVPQLRRTVYAGGQSANEVLGQVLFTIGAHGAHPF